MFCWTGFFYGRKLNESRRTRLPLTTAVSTSDAPNVPDAPVKRMGSATVMPAWLSIVEKTVFRFDESETARKEAAPSLSFVYPKLREEEIHVDSNIPEFVPVFEADGVNQIVTFRVSIC